MIDCLARMGHPDSSMVAFSGKNRLGYSNQDRGLAPCDDNRLSYLLFINQTVTGREARASLPRTDLSSIPRAAVSSSASSTTTSAPLGLSIVLAQFHPPQPALRSSAQLWPLALAHLLLPDSCAFDHVSFFPSLYYVLSPPS